MKNSFEQNMSRVAEVAEALDKGGLSLDASLKLYKEAVETIGKLQGELEAAEGSVTVMRKSLEGRFIEEEVSEDEF